MRRVYLYLCKPALVFFLVSALFFQSPVLFCQDAPVRAQALKSFRITPNRKATFSRCEAVYNPNLNHYIILFTEYEYNDPSGPHQSIYTQMITPKGKKAGALNRLRTSHGNEDFIPYLDLTLNEKENEFLVVWPDRTFDEIRGILLNGDGRLMLTGGNERSKTIKPSSGSGTAYPPKAAWIPSTNQYAVAWTSRDHTKPSSLDNGFYLSIHKPNLKYKLRPTKVRQQSQKNYIYIATTLLPIGERLLWGSAQDSAKKMKPVVWFTDLQGEVLTGTHTKRDGSIFPGKKVRGSGHVYTGYNPYHDQFLLIWNAADKSGYLEETYRDTYYRMMNSDGSFASKKRKMPKYFRFHSAYEPIFNPITNNFLVVYSEHKHLYLPDPPVEFKDGRLWATYIDAYGVLGLPDSPREKAFPLTDLFADYYTSMRYIGTVYNSLNNEYLVLFLIADYLDPWDVDTEIWGIILKEN